MNIIEVLLSTIRVKYGSYSDLLLSSLVVFAESKIQTLMTDRKTSLEKA